MFDGGSNWDRGPFGRAGLLVILSSWGKMRSVLLVTQDLQRAGAQRQCVELAIGLQRSTEWKVAVATIDSEGPLAAELREAGITIHGCPRRWRWDLAPVRGLASIARDSGYQLIHSFLFLPNFYARCARVLNRRPAVISSLRSTGVAGWPRYLLEVLMAPLSDLIIANSESGKRHLISLGAAAWRIAVVRNGIDLSRFAPGDSAHVHERDARVHGRRIGMVAQIEPRKDHLGLVSAFVELYPRYPGLRLTIAGDGSLRPRVEDAVRRAGVEEAVDFLGTVDRADLLYRGLDVYIQASAFGEGTSNSIIEAMASGLPVIATDVGGNSDVVDHERTGLMIPPRDPKALAAAIARLLDDAALRSRFGAAGRARALERYSRESMVATTVMLYEKVLAQRG